MASMRMLFLMTLIVLVSSQNTASPNEVYDIKPLNVRAITARAPPPIRPPIPDNEGDREPNGSHLICTPFGACEPCPPASLHQPFCQPFGNRRLMHCVNATESGSESPRSPQADEGEDNKLPHEKGETLAWEACGRIPEQERADFFEFVACNVIFAIVALGLVMWRSKVVQSRQARVLAARIGLVQSGRR